MKTRLGPSPMAMDAIRSVLDNMHRYPDDGGHELIHRLATQLSVAPETIVLGNGSDEVLTMLARAFLSPGDIGAHPATLIFDV